MAQKRDEVLSTLEGDLIRQVQICEQNQVRRHEAYALTRCDAQEYFTRAGDVAQVARFEQMATDSKRDLLTLRNAVARRDALPGFHYESRLVFVLMERFHNKTLCSELPVLRCNADLGDDELELGIVRVLTAPLPEGYEMDHADIYVTWEMSYPDKDRQKVRLLSKATMFDIDRRAQQSACKAPRRLRSMNVVDFVSASVRALSNAM